MKVLIGVDGTDNSLAAVRLTGRLLSPQHDQVAFFYAPPAGLLKAGSVNPALSTRAREAVVSAVFDEAAKHLPEAFRQNLERIEGTQPAKRTLLEAADRWNAELIVVGARGMSRLERVTLGSVSRAVAHNFRAAVLVVRGLSAQDAQRSLRVILASEPAGADNRVVELLSQLSFPADAQGSVATVIESMLAGELPPWLEERVRKADTEELAKAWVEEHARQRDQAVENMRSLCRQLPPTFHRGEPILAEGPPADRILETLESENADLVVVGAHGRGLLERLLVGSTSEKILAHANCSVLIVRQTSK
ncbi:MAG: universal stress protein [Pirellulales bacterium]